MIHPISTGAQISKIMAQPDSTVVGTGKHAIVIKRSRPEQSIIQKALEKNPLAKKSPDKLSRAEQQILDEMQARDREVRGHEQKHIQAAGSLAKGSPEYDYQIGPDGRPYAVAGRVRIDTSPVAGGAQANRAKAALIQNAAMAPGDPSVADQNLVSKATQSMQQKMATMQYGLNANPRNDLQAWPLRIYA